MNRYLALGDSYTIGEAVPESGRWPVRLTELLRAAGVPIAAPAILATTGWTTAELAEAIAVSLPEPGYDLVSLLIGVNDQYRENDLEVYRSEFAGLLEQAIGFAGGDPGRVIVLSIPDWGATPFARNDPRGPETITMEVVAFNTVNREEAKRLGVAYIDIFPLSQAAYDDPALIAGDGLHPSAAQYEAWARAALPTALEILAVSK
jgi:lysophospholipase L1-like esterase